MRGNIRNKSIHKYPELLYNIAYTELSSKSIVIGKRASLPQRMNIAFINPEYPSASGRDHGGIATYIYNQANALASLGHTVHVLVKQGVIPDPLHTAVRIHHVKHTPIRFSSAAMFHFGDNSVAWERGWSKAMKLTCLQINGDSKLDIVEIPEYNGLAYEFDRGLPFSVVIHFHTPTSLVDALNLRRESRSRRRWYRFERAALRNAAAFKCTSTSLTALLPAYCRVPGGRPVKVIYNPMPAAFSDHVKRRDGGHNRKRIDILFTGRLERRKGAEIILRVLNDILGIDKRIHMTFAGETDVGESETYRQAIERALDKEGRERVWFLGAVERLKLPALYRRSDIFCIPSLFDNAPNSLFEAMAARLPVVAADVGGINEIIRDGENGLLFPINDPLKMVECIRQLIASPDMAKRLAQKAYENVVSLYNPEHIARQTIAFYEDVLMSTKPRRATRSWTGWARVLFKRLPPGVQIRLRGRVSLLYAHAGYGDTLLVGAVAREIKRVYGPVSVTVNGVREELLRGNPWVDHVGKRYDGIDLNYHHGPHHVRKGFTENLLDIMCARVGIRAPSHTVDIFLAEHEIMYAREIVKDMRRPLVTLQTSSGSFGAGRKLWPMEYWERLAGFLLAQGCSVVQLGGADDTPVQSTCNRLGGQDIRRSIAIIKEADLHIGVVSALMHGAEAVHTPAIIIFGGFERFSAHGYSSIHPIETSIDCSPCAEQNTAMTACPRNNRCMRQISPEMVLTKARELLSMRGYELPDTPAAAGAPDAEGKAVVA